MEIGGGGSATVSVALSSGIAGFSKVVVLKSLRDGLGRDEDTVKRFLAEARLSARMNHPNVVQVYEVFKQKDLPVIVMEYLEGQSLATLLSRSGADPDFPAELGIAILVRTLAGLHYVHTLVDYSGEPLQLVHRDVSPHNVMVGYDGQVKLVDFGIAKLKNQSAITREGVIKGKLCYMAPEQVQNQADHRTDIFAVGVMLWEILARQRLWGDAGEAAIITRLLTEDIPRLGHVLPDADPELERICSKALAAAPEQRYAHASDMQRDLEAYLKHRPVSVSQEAIGQLLDHTCRDLREQTQAALQEKIMALGMSLTRDIDASEDYEGARSAVHALRLPQPRLRWLAGVGAVGGAVALVGAAAFLRTPAPSELGAPSAALAPAAVVQQAPPRPVESAPRERVTVNLSVTPQDARLYLDDRRLASNPFRDSLPRDSLEHTFRAQADGFEDFENVVRLESDVYISVSMRAEETTKGQVPISPHARRKATASRARSPAANEEAAGLPISNQAPQSAPATSPKTLAPGEDLRAGRALSERRSVEFDDPYAKE
jgi:serine/threonine protein kinase